MMTPEKRKELMAKLPENVREMLLEQERVKEAKKKEKIQQQYQKAVENKKKKQEKYKNINQKGNPFINKFHLVESTDNLEPQSISTQPIATQPIVDSPDEEKQLEVEINDRMVWISMALESRFYTDNDGNISLFWQREAQAYIKDKFTGSDDQDIIDKAIALLPKGEKALFHQLLNYEDDGLIFDEHLPRNEEVYDLDSSEDNNSSSLAGSIPDIQINDNPDNSVTNQIQPDNLSDNKEHPNDNKQWEGFSELFNQDKEGDSIESDNNQINYQLIEDNKELKEAIARLETEEVLGIDTETVGLDPHLGKLRLIQIASYNHPTVLIDCYKCDARLIQPLLINDSIKIFQNAKFDIQFFFALGLEVNQRIFDTMLAQQLLTAGISNTKASLKAIASEYLGIELSKDEQVSDWQSDKLSDSQLEYAVKDAEVLLPLREKLRQRLIDDGLTTVAKIEFDCVVAVALMEFNGMLLDVGQWQKILTASVKRKEELNRELQELLPSAENTLFPLDINFDSPQQLLEALNRAGVECVDTNSKTLKKLMPQYPEILKPLLEYKKVSKFNSSFGSKLLNKINPVTGRLHGSYNQLRAESGRFTSTNPNQQQIPRNQETRSCFVAQPNYKLVIADYSQIELRIAAEITKDSKMIKAYKNGEDLHKLTASIVLNKPLEEITKEDRQLAKACNFGLIYGQGVDGFRGYAESNYGVRLTEKEAQKIMGNFFKSYQGLAQWHKQTKRRIYNQGIDETRTLSGRIRYFDEPSPQQVLNTPVQGLGADMLKLALGKLIPVLEGYDCRILGTVHDEIILEAHESVANEVAKILSDTMVEAGKEFLKLVPVEAEASIGDNWADK